MDSMNGFEKLYYCENSEGRVFLTSPESPIPPGYMRHETTNPRTMDLIFAKMDAQTKREHQQMTEEDFNRRKEKIDRWRSDIRLRMQSVECTAMEKAFLESALRACDKREEKLNRNTVYGVSSMQTTEANPNAAGENPVHFDLVAKAVN